jgi:hypothetical protein
MIKSYALLAAIAVVAVGCQRTGVRQEGDLLTRSPAEIQAQPVGAIRGDTTGGGLPRDMRTGGGITGGELTGPEIIRATQMPAEPEIRYDEPIPVGGAPGTPIPDTETQPLE